MSRPHHDCGTYSTDDPLRTYCLPARTTDGIEYIELISDPPTEPLIAGASGPHIISVLEQLAASPELCVVVDPKGDSVRAESRDFHLLEYGGNQR